MKRLTRLLALMLVLVFCLTLLPGSALADDENNNLGDGVGDGVGEGVGDGDGDGLGDGLGDNDGPDDGDGLGDNDGPGAGDGLGDNNSPSNGAGDGNDDNLGVEGNRNNSDLHHATVQDDGESYEVVFLLLEPGHPSIPLLGGCGESYSGDSTNDFERSFRLSVVSSDLLTLEHPEDVTIAPDAIQNKLNVQSITFSGENLVPPPISDSNNWELAWTQGSRECSVTAPCQAGFDGALTANFQFNGQSYTVQVEVHYTPRESGDPGGSDLHHATVQDDGESYEVVFLLLEPEHPSIPLLGGCGESYSGDSTNDFERSFRLSVVSSDLLTLEHPEDVTIAPDAIQNKLNVQSITFSGENLVPPPISDSNNWELAWTQGSRECSITAPCQAGFDGILTACFTFNSQSYTIQVEVHYLPQGGSQDGPVCSVPVSVGESSYNIVFLFQGPGGENIALWTGDGRPYSDDDTEGFDCSYLLGAVVGKSNSLADTDVQNRITVKSITFTGQNDDGTTSPHWTLDWEAGAHTCRLTAPCKAGFSGTLNAVFDFNDGVTTEEHTIQLPLVYERDPFGGPSGPSDPNCSVPVSVGEASYDVVFLIQLPDRYIALWRRDGLPYGDYDTEGFDCSYLLGAVVDKSNSLADTDVQNRITVKSITFSGQNDDGTTSPHWTLDWEDGARTCRLTAPCKAGFSGTLEAVFDFDDGVTTEEHTIQLPLVYERDPYAIGVPSDMTIQEVRFGAQLVTVGAGFLENGALSVGGNAGSIFEPDQQMSFYRQYVLGGMLNYNTHNEIPATKAFFERIMSCSVEVESCEGTAPTVTTPVKVAYSELDDAELYTFEITSSVPSQPFDATFVLTFTYQPDDWEAGDPPESYTLRFSAFYRESPNKTIDASNLDTTEKLNAALASKAAFASYLEAAGVNYNWDGVVTLNLPAVEYEGKVVCDIQPDGDFDCGVRLHGTSDPDAGRTTMHALDDRRGLFIIDNITFTANGVTQSYGGESFTCGVLVTGSEQAVGSSIGGIDDCSFSGYQYAVRGTPTGYPGSIRGCSFTNCTYGLYIDCEGLNGMVNVDVSGNIFSACQDAICIPNLPASISPYIYRIHDNLFLNSGLHDLNITQPGTIFCYGNYFGSDMDNRRTALLSEGPNTSIIVNPCRAVPYSSTYWIDPALPTRILNQNASSIAIDVSTFGNNQSVTISVVDLSNSGISTVGTWTFGGAGA